MRLLDALRDVRRLGLDSAPLIYFIEQHHDYFARMLYVLRSVDEGSLEGVSSTITLAEVLVHPLRTAHHELANRYETLLLHGRGLRLEPVTAAIARRAADLRARYDLRTPDALHMATAVETGCDAFLTNDRGIKRVNEIKVLVLNDLELDLP